MGQKYLIDSNVLIDYTAGLLPQSGSDFVEQIIVQDFLISVIIKIEVLGYADIPLKMKSMEAFVGLAEIIPLDDSVTDKTIALRRSYKGLKLGDAVIAATAIENNLVLITRNTADFKNIQGLQILNPHLL
jgi:predicted nucleic acid-binding protein